MHIKYMENLCLSGKKPVIKMKDNIGVYVEESVDPGMVGKLISFTEKYGDSYRLLIDMNGYEEHNKSVAVYDWSDGKGNMVKSWFDTEYYPEDGIEEIYLPKDIDIPFEIVDDSSLFYSYLEEGNDLSYVEWLEDKLLNI